MRESVNLIEGLYKWKREFVGLYTDYGVESVDREWELWILYRVYRAIWVKTFMVYIWNMELLCVLCLYRVYSRTHEIHTWFIYSIFKFYIEILELLGSSV